MEQLIISLISGAVGGNAAGAALKKLDLSVLLKTVVGAIGGVGGGQLLAMLGGAGGMAEAAGGMDIGAIASQVIGGGGGGAILTAIVGLIKNAMAKS